MKSNDTTIDNFLNWDFDFKHLNHQIDLRAFAIKQETFRRLDSLKDKYPFRNNLTHHFVDTNEMV